MAKLNIITLGSSKNYTDLAAFGLTNVVVNDQDKTISFTLVADGSTRTLHFDQPSDGKDGTDGIGISKIEKIGTVDLVDTYRITFTDNSTFDYEVKNGKDGADGYTPVKGTDYFDGQDGFSPTITENADNTDKIYRLDIETVDGKFTTPNLKGADGQGGTGGSGEENKIDSISVNGVNVVPDVNKNVDITVPSIDGLAKTEDIPTKVSELTNDSGYLTEHQDISGKVDKVDGKSLIADTEIERLASVDNYDDTQVKTQIQAVANGLMDSVGYSADYKTIDIIAKNGVKKSVNVAPIISHASITELSDVDTTNKATGKALVYNATTSKHEYADVSGTDEKVKMDASTDAKYLGELLDNVTIANENGELKVKKLDGQEVTITEINYLKGLTMNVMDLVNMFSNGGVKIINTPVATYAELLTIDKSSFIEGISYLVYVLTDENHDNAKTTYLVDKVSETPTYFGFADSQRDFTTNPIDLATEITGKLGISNMDSDAIKALFTVDDTYKTETATNNAFSTHGAKALYDELLLAIGNKANSSDLTAHKDDADIHVSTEDRTKWDSAKTHADSAHAPSNAQENVIETIKINNQEITPDENKAVNIDLSDYAKKTDIPTTLPANGGNSDTVNNHTVESDVPENAVFTDTIYDDTEVKGSIAKLSSNLDTLSYGDESGNSNLLNLNKCSFNKNNISISLEDNEITVNGSYYSNLLFDKLLDAGSYSISFEVKSSTSSYKVIRVLYEDNTYSDEIYRAKNIVAEKKLKGLMLYSSDNADVGTAVFKNIQIEKGTTATEYEPYIPSVKMLAEEVTAQNDSLDTLEYGDTHGGYNIFKDTTWFVGRHMAENGINDYPETGSAYSDYISIVEPNTYYISSSTHPKSTVFEYDANKSFIKYNGWKKDNNTPCVLSGNCAYIRISFNGASSNIQPSNVMLAKTPNLPYVPYIPSVKMIAEEVSAQNESLSVIGKCKNLLNPTLATTTINGVTCTNNGDGTYTLNGTASGRAIFAVCGENFYALSHFVGDAKIVKQIFSEQSIPGSDGNYANGYYFAMQGKDQVANIYIDEIVVDDYVNKTYRPIINVSEGITVDNLVFKPMLTTNLNATYDDFVPYTGDGDTLTHDVAELKNDLGGLTFSASGTTLTITDGTNTWTLGANS